jgi:hypothetical protein
VLLALRVKHRVLEVLQVVETSKVGYRPPYRINRTRHAARTKWTWMIRHDWEVIRAASRSYGVALQFSDQLVA